MSGIEGLWNGGKGLVPKKPIMKQVPVDVAGATAAKAAPDADIDEYIREEVIPEIKREEKTPTHQTQATPHYGSQTLVIDLGSKSSLAKKGGKLSSDDMERITEALNRIISEEM